MQCRQWSTVNGNDRALFPRIVPFSFKLKVNDGPQLASLICLDVLKSVYYCVIEVLCYKLFAMGVYRSLSRSIFYIYMIAG